MIQLIKMPKAEVMRAIEQYLETHVFDGEYFKQMKVGEIKMRDSYSAEKIVGNEIEIEMVERPTVVSGAGADPPTGGGTGGHGSPGGGVVRG